MGFSCLMTNEVLARNQLAKTRTGGQALEVEGVTNSSEKLELSRRRSGVAEVKLF